MNSNQDNKLLCYYCFSILEYFLDEKKQSGPEPEFPKEFIGKSFPLFVTWTTRPSKDLRGCIGTFQSEKLEKNLKRYCLISALKDDRFEPISVKEIPSLNVEVSLLVEFEECKNASDWEVGKHGIEIDFEVNGNDYGATFLPDVAAEEGWDQKTTLHYLIRNAGYNGKLESIYDKIHTKRYQSIKCTVSYSDYTKNKK